MNRWQKQFALLLTCVVSLTGVFLLTTRTPSALAQSATTRTATSPSTSTNDPVEKSLRRGKTWLYGKQKNGHWETTPARDAALNDNALAGGQWGGSTAMALYALLAAGENPQDPRLAPAIEFLRKSELIGTYALAMRILAFSYLPETPENSRQMQRDGELLVSNMLTEKQGAGMYGYYRGAGKNNYSHSRAQYGVLGVWTAAEYAGLNVPDRYWQFVEASWIRNQDKSGGWRYHGAADPLAANEPITPSMTAAGVASLFITQDFVHASDGLDCRGNVTNPSIDRGLAWLTANIDKVASDVPFPRDFPYAMLYGIERIGVASGLKFIGKVDWYEKGSRWLITKQKSDGSWSSKSENASSELLGGLPDTCFAMLFLARGRTPIAVNKLDYSTEADKAAPWNQRPRDVANVLRWTSRQIERDLHWQITNLSADADQLSDAPILYISGSKPVQLDQASKDKLRLYVQRGGMIVAHADCGSPQFTASIRKLGSELFDDYEFRALPDDHPIYLKQMFRRDKWKSKPQVLALGNGVRELIVLLPAGDPARWQSQQDGAKQEAYQLFANILLYATDRQPLLYRGESQQVARNAKLKPSATLKLARLQYAGNWNPEPGGWERLSNILFNRKQIELRAANIKLGESLDGYKVAHLTGTAQLKFDSGTKATLKAFLKAGGLLVVDAAGGSPDFAQGADAALLELVDNAEWTTLPADHPIWSAGGARLPDIRYRRFATDKQGSLGAAPRVKAILQAGKPVVLYSAEDLSAGMVGQQVDGIVGYDPASATEIMLRFLMYASK